MHTLFDRVLKYRWQTVLICLLCVGLLTAGAQRLVFKNDYRIFFSEDNPQLQNFERMQKAFSKTDNLLFILIPASGQVFTPQTLEAVAWLTEQAWQTPYSSRVDSLSNFQYTYGEEDDLIVEDLIVNPATLNEEALTRIREIVYNEPALVRRLVSLEGDVTAVNVTLQLPGVEQTKEIPEVVEFANQLKAELAHRYPDMQVMMTGLAMMSNAFAESAKNDSMTLIPAMFVAIILLIGLLNQTVTGMLATLLVVTGSILAALGLAGWSGFFLSGPSASSPTVIMTVAVADCVHILATFYQGLRRGEEKATALLRSLRINLKPVLLTSLTTAIGFLSMNFSDSPPFRDLGNIVAMGVLIACTLSLTLLPALLMLLPCRIQPGESRSYAGMQHFADWVIRYQRRILLSMSLVAIGIALLLPLNQLNDNFVEYFDRTVPFRQASDFMNDHLTGLAYLEVELNTGTAQGINRPAFLNKAEAFVDWARAQPEVHHVQTLTDTLKRLNMNLHGDDSAYYRLAQQQDETAQYLLLYEMSLPYGLDLNNQINIDKSAIRIVLSCQNMTSKQQLEMEQRVVDWLAENAPEITTAVSGPPLMFAHIGQRNIVSMLGGTSIALLLISAVLAIALKSVRYGVLSLVPNLAPMMIGFGLWALLVGEIGLGLSVVSGMTLGIVVDDTVHFLSKYLHARREEGLSPEEAIRYAFTTVGRALWITTLVLVVGFSILAQSSFRVNSDMGLLTAATIAIALVMDFLLLPTLLLFADRAHKSSAATDAQESPS